jgi:hypothetical protein
MCVDLNYLGFCIETSNLKELLKPRIPGWEAGKPEQRVHVKRTAETIARGKTVLKHQLLKTPKMPVKRIYEAVICDWDREPQVHSLKQRNPECSSEQISHPECGLQQRNPTHNPRSGTRSGTKKPEWATLDRNAIVAQSQILWRVQGCGLGRGMQAVHLSEHNSPSYKRQRLRICRALLPGTTKSKKLQ